MAGGNNRGGRAVGVGEMIGLLLLTVLAVAYANGANDNFKATATIYGSETLGYRGALALATVAQLLGSVACVFVAARLVRAFGGQGLVPEATVADPVFLVAVGVGAAATVLLATRLGLPVSTTHALIGGLVGAGLAAAPASIEWSNLTGRFMLPLLISPLLSVLIAGGLYPVLSRLRRRMGVDEVTCLCIARTSERVDTAADGTFILGRTGIALSVEEVAQCRQRYDGTVLGLSAQTICDRLHEVSGFALGFARGLNDTPKVLGLLVAATWSGLSSRRCGYLSGRSLSTRTLCTLIRDSPWRMFASMHPGTMCPSGVSCWPKRPRMRPYDCDPTFPKRTWPKRGITISGRRTTAVPPAILS